MKCATRIALVLMPRLAGRRLQALLKPFSPCAVSMAVIGNFFDWKVPVGKPIESYVSINVRLLSSKDQCIKDHRFTTERGKTVLSKMWPEMQRSSK